MRSILAVGLLGVGLTVAVSAQGGTLAPGKASRVIEAESNGNSCPGVASALVVDMVANPDGTETSGFTVPPGQVLVITDVGFSLSAPGSGGHVVSLSLARFNSPSTANVIATAKTLLGSQPDAAVNVPLRGAIVKSGTTLCVICFDVNSFSPITTLGCSVNIHGFFAKDS